MLAATRAARTESGSLGRITISWAPQPVIASSSWPVEGRRPGPPSTTTAPASAKSAARPGPAATAITVRPVRAGARAAPELVAGGAAICSAKWVTRIRCGRPMARPASIAAPTSSTWTWTFHSPSPPTTTTESPSSPSRARSGGISPSWVSRRYITSYDGPSLLRSPAPRRRHLGHRDRVLAERVGHRHRAPAGEDGLGRVEDDADPAAAGVDDPGPGEHLELLGRVPSASRAAAAAALITSWVRAAGSLTASAAPSAAARATVSIVPSTGSPTAA